MGLHLLGDELVEGIVEQFRDVEVVVDDRGIREIAACPGGVRLAQIAADPLDPLRISVVLQQPVVQPVHGLGILLLAQEYDPLVLIGDDGDVVVALLRGRLVYVQDPDVGQIHKHQGLFDPVTDHLEDDAACKPRVPSNGRDAHVRYQMEDIHLHQPSVGYVGPSDLNGRLGISVADQAAEIRDPYPQHGGHHHDARMGVVSVLVLMDLA